MEERVQTVLHPGLGLLGGVLVGRGVEGVGGPPQVFEDVHDVEHDGDLDTRGVRSAPHAPELVGLTVEEHHPPPPALGVPSQRLGERVVDHPLGTVLDARPDPLVGRP